MSKLDRFFINNHWGNQYPECIVEHLPIMESDHSLIITRIIGQEKIEGHKPFIYKKMWSTHPDFQVMVQLHWNTVGFYPNL